MGESDGPLPFPEAESPAARERCPKCGEPAHPGRCAPRGYQLVRRARHGAAAEALGVASGAVKDLREQHKPVQEAIQGTAHTALVNDHVVRTNAATTEALADTVLRVAAKIRENLEAPPVPPPKGALEIVVSGGVEIVKALFGGQGKELVALGSRLLGGLAAAAERVESDGLGPEAEPAAAEAGSADGPAQRPGAPMRAARLPELGVLFEELPDEIAEHLSLAELRQLAELWSKLKAEGRAPDLASLLSLLRPAQGGSHG